MNDTELVDAASRTAASWWASRLRDGVALQENGERDERRAMFARSVVSLIRAQSGPTAEQCASFERALSESIARQLITPDPESRYYYDRSGWDDGGVDLCLRVDYHPCHMLSAALSAAGVDAGVAAVAALPIKTTMRVSRRRVLLAHGYGQPFKEIHGPVWGSTHKEHAVEEHERESHRNAVYELWLSDRSRSKPRPDWSEWQGPVRPIPGGHPAKAPG